MPAAGGGGGGEAPYPGGDLVEARALYARHGHVEIPAWSQGPHAEHWFEKVLAGVDDAVAPR